jgi:hypothetical protein
MLEALISQFARIEDPRCEWKVEHKLIDVLVILICAVRGEAESFEDIALYGRCKRDWLQRFLELRGGIPLHDTFRRVLMPVDPGRFERCFLDWVRSVFRPDAGAPPADRDRRQDSTAVVRPPERPLAPAPGQRVRGRARAGAGAACDGCQKGRADGAAQPARRPGPARLPGQPGCPRRPTRGRHADHRPWWRLSLLALTGNQTKAHAEVRLGSSPTPSRWEAPYGLASMPSRMVTADGYAGASSPAPSSSLGRSTTLAGLDDSAGDREHPEHQRLGQGHGRVSLLSLQQRATPSTTRDRHPKPLGDREQAPQGGRTGAARGRQRQPPAISRRLISRAIGHVDG